MEKKLDDVLNSFVASNDEVEVRNKLLAAGFVLANKDGVTYTGTAGRLDFDPSSPAYTPDSMSWVASLTKLGTAVAMLQLVERGIIELDVDIRDTLPELAAMPVLRGFSDDGKPILEEHGREITLRHLLSHTLAICMDIPDPDLTRWSKYVGRTDNYMSWTIEGITTPLKYAPGEGWCYGAAYDWAGLLLTRLTGKTLEQYMQENVFQPLGMTSTSYRPKTIPGSEARSLALAFSDEKGVLGPGPSPVPEEYPFEQGGCGLFSAPADYARLLHGILGHKVLKPETTDLLFAPQLNDIQRGIVMENAAQKRKQGFSPELPRDIPLDHGLGGLLSMEDDPGKRRKGSLMWSGMTNGRWWIDRQTGIAGAVLTHLLPYGNRVLEDMYDALERTAYESLGI
ncbi:beta-lactamase/transpeptidase-like protein [Poronia punctata]|nr:beta-lactamase/transpeptidase-like protein [Poronia punctata]